MTSTWTPVSPPRSWTLFAALSLALSLANCQAPKPTDEGGGSKTVTQKGEAQPNRASSSEEVVDAGCPGMRGESCDHGESGPALTAASGAPQLFGQALDKATAKSVELREVLHDPERFREQEVILSGFVRRACSRRGCWMEIATEESDASLGCRVTFKDYGFLVPTDSKGSVAQLQGRVQVTVIEAPAVAHYESEGARFSNKKADGSAREVRIVATGVELTRPS